MTSKPGNPFELRMYKGTAQVSVVKNKRRTRIATFTGAFAYEYGKRLTLELAKAWRKTFGSQLDTKEG
jgi:hypothetical protein